MGLPTIGYATPPRRVDRWMRRLRKWGLLAMALALLLRYEPPALRLAKNVWWQYQCARYTVPLDQVAFSGPYDAYSSAPNPPICFNNLVGKGFAPPVLFLHRLKNSHGSCVVAVTLDSHFSESEGFGEAMQVGCVKINRDGSFTKMLTDWNDADRKPSYAPTLTDLTLFAGQVDQTDPSAFTITYSSRDQCGCIIGRLEDDGKIHFHASQNLVNWKGQFYVPHGPLPTNDTGGI